MAKATPGSMRGQSTLRSVLRTSRLIQVTFGVLVLIVFIRVFGKNATFDTASASALLDPYFRINTWQEVQEHDRHRLYTEGQLRQLAACLGTGTCHRNAVKIAVFGCYHCHAAMFMNYRGGEGIWCIQMVMRQIEELQRQGYTVLFAREDWDYMIELHQQMPDMIKIVIATENRAKEYYKSPSRPNGIPAWKHMLFSYFPGAGGSVVGDRWTICAEPDIDPVEEYRSNFTYTGYQLDDFPPVVAHRPNRVWILAKRVQYFHQWAWPMWDPEFFPRATAELRSEMPDFEFVGAFVDDRPPEEVEAQGPISIPEGVRNLLSDGRSLNAAQFDAEVGQCRAMLGIGWPTDSPSPYRGLAMVSTGSLRPDGRADWQGLPFINPHKLLNLNADPEDRYLWHPQHRTLRWLEEPLIYQPVSQNYHEFVTSVRRALKTPIAAWRAPWMEHKPFSVRLRNLMETDWETDARRILDLRKAGVETQGARGNLDIFEL